MQDDFQKKKENDESMMYFLNTKTWQTLTVNCQASKTKISDLRDLFAQKFDCEACKIHLFHKQRPLSDEVLASDCGTTENDEIHIIFEPKTKASVQIFVKLENNYTVTIDIDLKDSVETLMQLIHCKIGLPPDQQRLIFGGKQLEFNQSLESYQMQKEATLYLIKRLRGGCIAAKHPAKFSSQDLLFLPQSKSERDALILAMLGDQNAKPSYFPSLLSAETCQKLQSIANLRNFEKLKQILLREEYERISEIGNFDFVQIRTLDAQNQSLHFHVDHDSVETLQICLNDNYTGGQTVYVNSQGTICFPPKIGHAILHEQYLVHGTTSLTSGTRITLFLCTKRKWEKDLLQYAQQQLQFYQEVQASDFWDNNEFAHHCRNLRKPEDKNKPLKMQEMQKALYFMQEVLACHFNEQELMNGVKEYLQFLGKEQEPSLLVDFIWHSHLHQPDYERDCFALTGALIHHNAQNI